MEEEKILFVSWVVYSYLEYQIPRVLRDIGQYTSIVFILAGCRV